MLTSYCWPSAKVTELTFADQVENAVPVFEAVKTVAVPLVPVKLVPFQYPFALPCFWSVSVTPVTPAVASLEVPVITVSVFWKLPLAGVEMPTSGTAVSTTMFFAFASAPELAAPTTRVRVALLAAASLTVPPFRVSAPVSCASRSALVSPACTV